MSVVRVILLLTCGAAACLIDPAGMRFGGGGEPTADGGGDGDLPADGGDADADSETDGDLELDADADADADGDADSDADAVADADGDADADSDADRDADEPPSFCDPTDPDLRVCLRFEGLDASGAVHDESMYGNHAAASRISFEPGVDARAVRTSPESVLVVGEDPSLDPPDEMTVELWVNPSSLPSSGRAGLADNQGQWGLFIYPGARVRCIIPPDGNAYLDGAVAVDTWTHLACTYDGSAMVLYVDGAPAVTNPLTGPIGTGGTDGLSVGANSPSGDPLDGLIDSLRFWSVARPASSICEAAGTC